MKSIHKSFLKSAVLCSFLILSLIACKKNIEVNAPPTALSSQNVFASDATAIAAVTGIYTKMSFTSLGTITGISVVGGLSADELTLFPGASNSTLINYYRNALTSTTSGTVYWNYLYQYIFSINSIIEGLQISESLTPSLKSQLLGEAKFMRAFLYFYLVNLYGDVPLVTTTDFNINSAITRSHQDQVYSQMITDLKDAKQILNADYLDGALVNKTNERVRPNKGAASALLARVYLYKKDWSNAEIESTAVINDNSRYDTVSLSKVFLANSKEALWQLQPVIQGRNTEDARIFILTPNGLSDSRPVYISDFLLGSFEVGDNRKTQWVTANLNASGTYYYPTKYKAISASSSPTEYTMVLRLAEQYLIRSEARAQLSKILEGLSDLNIIRKRAGLSNATANDQASLLTAILHERQVELFTEWAHRWLDLKRTGKVDKVMSAVTPVKGGVWSSNWQWYPIPQYDVEKNPKLIQNSGY